jgi:hypothetical protein
MGLGFGVVLGAVLLIVVQALAVLLVRREELREAEFRRQRLSRAPWAARTVD